MSPRAKSRLTLVLVVLTASVLLFSIPAALRDAYRHGGIYLFTQEFIDDIPRRLAGPGRMRFLVQPTVAILIGSAAGLRDNRAGRAPFLLALVLGKERRGDLLRSAMQDVGNIVLLGVLLDAVSQRIILGMAHPVVALIVGPVLVSGPYMAARALSNRVLTARRKRRAT